MEWIFEVLACILLAILVFFFYLVWKHGASANTTPSEGISLQGDVRISYVGRVYKLKLGYHLTIVVGSEYVFVDSHTTERICGYHPRYELWVTAVSGKWVMDKRGFKHMSFDALIAARKQAGDDIPFLYVPLISPPESNPETPEETNGTAIHSR